MIHVFTTKYISGIAKVNYIDCNNRFAGFDLWNDCYEESDHWVEDANGNKVEPNSSGNYDYLIFTSELPEEGFEMFDNYYVKIPLKHRITNEKYFLVFSNCHNGWYAHGYEFGKMVIEKEGCV